MATLETAKKIVDSVNKSPDSMELLNYVLRAFPQVTLNPSASGDLFASNEGKYLELLMGAMEYAIFPHATRPHFASFVQITTRSSSWQWVYREISQNVPNPDWMHAANLGKVAHIFTKLFFAMGRCKFPIYLSPEQAEQWFDMWRLINETRMTRNDWSFMGKEVQNLSPSLVSFRTIC